MSTHFETNTMDLVTCSIYCNKQPISDNIQMLSLFVSSTINEIPSGKLVVLDGGGPSNNFPISSTTVFDLGSDIEIRAGYEGIQQIIFQGVISKHSIKNTADSGPELIVDFKGVAEETEIKDVSAILQQSEAEPILGVTNGAEVLEFIGEIDDGRESINLISSDFDARGYVRIQGNPILHTGSTIELYGFGKRLSGRALIYHVEHLIAEGNWITEVNFYKHANKVC